MHFACFFAKIQTIHTRNAAEQKYAVAPSLESF
jgi:hypothetical protein